MDILHRQHQPPSSSTVRGSIQLLEYYSSPSQKSGIIITSTIFLYLLRTKIVTIMLYTLQSQCVGIKIYKDYIIYFKPIIFLYLIKTPHCCPCFSKTSKTPDKILSKLSCVHSKRYFAEPTLAKLSTYLAKACGNILCSIWNIFCGILWKSFMFDLKIYFEYIVKACGNTIWIYIQQ